MFQAYNHFVNQIQNQIPMHQAPSQATKTQYLTLIDKCTQILREDRIWLRNLLKGNNEEVYYLFRGLPKNIDMKQLQIKLRKYIMRAKEKQKQEQLQRFKENMHLPEFIEVAQEKRHQPQHNKSQTKLRGTLKQFQSNEPKSSFVAKWNNYTHYNQSINLHENRSHAADLQSSQSQNKSLNKQWTNNYKPHSFNKSLNGELANKLSSKNSSLSRMNNRHNKSSTSLTKEKSSIVNSRFHNNEQVDELNQSSKYPFGGARSSSKSLKQLESKIYEQLRQFQHNKAKKEQQLSNNRSFSQRSVQKPQEKPHQNFVQPQPKPSTISKENIDQILKMKLGNCDYEVYRKSQETEHDQDPAEYVFMEKTASQKKLYEQGYFPPIEEQTERDSQSQRYPEQPLRFGMMNMSSKPQSQDRHKLTFASFAKASPSQSFKNYEITDAKMITSTNHINEFTQQLTTQQPITYQTRPESFTNNNTASLKNSFQEPIPVNRISESLYASAQKKSDVNENYIQSDLHKSIMESIQRSREVFPQVGYQNSSNNVREEKFGEVKNVSSFNFQADHSIGLPLPKPVSDVSSFQSSLYSSTHDEQGLFTSPDLLNQCRNFLKKTQQINFQNSGLKQMTGSIIQSKFDSPVNSQQKSFRQTFNNLSSTGMLNFPQPITITESITKDFYNNPGLEARINSLFESKQSSVSKGENIEFQTYSKPEYIGGEDSFKKSDFMESSMKKSQQKNETYGQQSIKKDEISVFKNHSRKASSMKKHSQIQETIAFPQNLSNHFNMSNTSKHSNYDNQQSVNVENFKTSEFPNVVTKTGNSARKQVARQEEQPINSLIDLQDVIDKILQANEGNIEVDSTWLKHTINNRLIFDEQVGVALKKILASYINSPDATYNFIELITCVEQQYKKNPTYQPRKSPSRDMCSLLDIEEKGFITFDDVQNFVTQLQNAGVDHIEEIAHHLEEVFEIADFMNLKQISYVNLYIIKNQDCFESLWTYLQEFEFEIAAEQE